MSSDERKEEKLKAEGFQFAGLFGCDLRNTMSALRKALKPHGLTVERRSNGDDQSWIKIRKIS